MKIQELKKVFINALSGLYPSEEILSFFNILTEKFLKLNRLDIALKPNLIISETDSEKIINAIYRLEQFEPIQYITGETEFFGLKFSVNKNVLIPRPETEGLVSRIITFIKSLESKSQNIADIGTGSGCIAVALARNLPHCQITALDVSEEALKIAKQNALKTKVKINFIQEDILKCKALPEKYNVIVSNPPYVSEKEKNSMQPNVLQYEPNIALFVKDDDPLIFYRKIAQLGQKHLLDHGSLFFEINEYLSSDLVKLLKIEGYHNIEVIKDIFGKDRMVKCKREKVRID